MRTNGRTTPGTAPDRFPRSAAYLRQPHDAQRASQGRPGDARALADKRHAGRLLPPFAGHARRGGRAPRGAVLLAGYCQTSVKRPRRLAGAFLVLRVFSANRGFLWRARQDSNLRPSLFVARPAQGQGATGRDTGRQNRAFIRKVTLLKGQGRTGRDTGLWYRYGTKGERHSGILSFSETWGTKRAGAVRRPAYL